MTPAERAKAFRKIGKDWNNERAAIALKAAHDATDAIIERVRENRVNDQGAIFGNYADSTMKRKIKQSDDKRVNFSDKNIMLNSTKPQLENINEKFVIVRIKPRRPDREIVLGYLEEKFDKIIELSSAERTQINQDYSTYFDQFIRKHQ